MTSIRSTGVGMRLALLLAFIVSILALSGGIALAATITCQAGVGCLGTKTPTPSRALQPYVRPRDTTGIQCVSIA